jgi:hypothetical protein
MSDAGIDAASPLPGVIIPQTVVRAGDEAALGRASWGRFFSHVAFAVRLERIWLAARCGRDLRQLAAEGDGLRKKR